MAKRGRRHGVPVLLCDTREGMRVLVFLHGTTIMHASGVGRSRAERVRQVRERDPSVLDYTSYIAVGDAARKLNRWDRQGAQISYLSSHREERNVASDRAVLERAGFPPGDLWHRRPGREYRDIVAELAPDVLIEDDCESIGGSAAMTYSSLDPSTRSRVHSIVVPEFGGIDHLPDSAADLASW